MAFAYQLDLFENNDPVTLLQKDFRLLDKKCQNVQRGLFARFGTLEEKLEMVQDLCFKQRIEIEALKAKLGDKAEIIEFPVQCSKK
jgi:ketopantoate reductase